MSSSCPACGEAMEFAERPVTLRTGTCPTCQKEFAFVEGSTLSQHLPPASEASAATPVGAPIEVAEDAPECDECGSVLTFRAGRAGAVLAVCGECETTTVLRPESAEEEAPTERRRSVRRDVPGAGAPRGRPCRRCGAPLRFTTGEDGLLVGECDSCGNRFTLPARPGEGRRGYGPRDRSSYGRGGYRPSRGLRPNFRDRGPGGSRPFAGPDRHGRPPSDEDDRRRRRRRRDE